MTYFTDKYRVESGRKIGWNYSSPGIYFITICTLNHNNFLGKIIDDQMIYKRCGEIVKEELLKTFEIRKNLKLIDWVVMPNHVHILFSIENYQSKAPEECVETCRRRVSTHTKTTSKNNIHKPEIAIKKWQANSVGSIINQIKSISTKRIRKEGFFFAWQTRYYDEIIDNQKRLELIKLYIKNNPKNWQKDKFWKM